MRIAAQLEIKRNLLDTSKNWMSYSPTNREKSKRAKRIKAWCHYCDQCLISLTQKCPLCGRRHNRKKLRLPNYQ